MAKAVKLKDIGDKLGVSAVTVSKALSGQKGVSEEMREKIVKTAEEMGYRSLSDTRSGGKRKTHNVGVIIAEHFFDKTQSFYWTMYQELAMRAVQKDCFTMLEVVSSENEMNLKTPRLLEGSNVDGLIVIGLFSDEFMELIEKKARIPYIYLDFYTKDQECDSVVTDNFYGMYRMVDYLFSMGHRKIAYVGTLFRTSSVTDRYFGYCKAMMEHGEEIRKEYVLADQYVDMEHPERWDELRFTKETMPTAFACNCDMTAEFIRIKLEEKGYRVPEDVSIVGFDNYVLPAGGSREYTTYEVDMKEMVRRAIHNLIYKMDGQDYKRGCNVIEGKMIIRDTVRKLK